MLPSIKEAFKLVRRIDQERSWAQAEAGVRAPELVAGAGADPARAADLFRPLDGRPPS
jgi:hypothetical protein